MDHIPTDDPELEEFAIAEDELIDAYVCNELSANERKLIETSPRLVERVHFAKLLTKAASPVPQLLPSGSAAESNVSVAHRDSELAKPPWWKASLGFLGLPAFRTALAACVIIVLIGGVALIDGWMKLRSESQRLASERTALDKQRQEFERQSAAQQGSANQIHADLQAAREQLERDQKQIEELAQAQKENEQSQRSMNSTPAIAFLYPGSARGGGGGNEVSVSPGAATINLKLVLDSDEYLSYRVIIRNAQNVAIQRDGLKPRHSRSGQIVSIRIPAKLLAPDNYTVLLSGVTSSGAVEPINDYMFRITVRQK